MKDYRVISFGTYFPSMYRNGIARIYRQCQEFKIANSLRILGPANQPNWYGAVLFKPLYMREMLQAHNQTLVWIDADCRLLEPFDLPEGDWDIGLIPHQIPRNRIYFTPWLVSCLAIRPTPQTRLLLDMWIHFCQWLEFAGIEERRPGDHERLMWVLSIMGDTIKVKNILPYMRDKIYLDPRHRKRNKLSYKEVPRKLDDWYPDEIKLPKDKCEMIIERVGTL